MPNVFISHSREGGDIARAISEALKKRGVETWMAGDHLRLGDDIRSTVGTGIAQADAFVVVEGSRGERESFRVADNLHAIESEMLLTTVTTQHKKLIPVLFGLNPSPFWRNWQSVRVDESGFDPDAVADQIANALARGGENRGPLTTAEEEARRQRLEQLGREAARIREMEEASERN